MAFVDPSRLVLSLREASVGDSGDVGFGSERTVPLTEIGSVLSEQGEVTVRGHDGRTLVQMHFESQQDEAIWAQGLRAAIGSDASVAAGAQTTEEGLTNGGSEEEEMHMLQARSRQLQNRIGSLEAISERRDHQIQKMVKRLDGAMQMLAAVQDMCGQQCKVVEAQRVAITALRSDLGWSENAEAESISKSAQAGTGEGGVSPGGTAEEDVEEEEEEEDDSQGSPGPSYPVSSDRQVMEGDITAEAEKMLALLKQADEMQRMLQMLEARGAELALDDDQEVPAVSAPPSRSALTAAELSAPAMPMSPTAATSVPAPVPLSLAAQAEADEPEPAPHSNGEEEADSDEAVRERLRALEAEKEHFEGLLRESQQEHEDLLSRLTSMRSLMSALGTLDDGEGADGEDAGEEDEDESA